MRRRSAWRAGLQTALDEEPDVLRAGAAECRFPNHLAVHNGPVVVGAIAVVVDTRHGIERARGGEHHQRAGGDVVREVVAGGDDGAVPLIDHARSALLLSVRAMFESFGLMPLPSGSVVLVAFDNV